jgi:hypothetical protein
VRGPSGASCHVRRYNGARYNVTKGRRTAAGMDRGGHRSGELVDLPANAFAAILVALADGLMLQMPWILLDSTGPTSDSLSTPSSTDFEETARLRLTSAPPSRATALHRPGRPGSEGYATCTSYGG